MGYWLFKRLSWVGSISVVIEVDNEKLEMRLWEGGGVGMKAFRRSLLRQLIRVMFEVWDRDGSILLVLGVLTLGRPMLS